MSTPNQKSIKSFFQAPKHSRSSLESEEVQDTTNNSRPFKFARVSTPTLNNMDQDDFDIDEDSDDINDNDIQLVQSVSAIKRTVHSHFKIQRVNESFFGKMNIKNFSNGSNMILQGTKHGVLIAHVKCIQFVYNNH